MRFSELHAGPHYYVLSLGSRTNVLFEAFRDTLIDIQNGGFPVATAGVANASGAAGDDERLRDVMRLVDRCFGGYQRQEPLKLVVVGESRVLAIFSSTTIYPEAILGRIEGDYSATSPHDLGKIVWPVVKDAISGTEESALQRLESFRNRRELLSGIDAVSREAGAVPDATLLVEGDYHVRGSICEIGSEVAVSEDIDVTEAMDDVVDIIIERVVAAGGHVVFLPSGALGELKRIVLLPPDGDAA